MCIDLDDLLGNWTLAKLYPRTGAKDTLAVWCHPGLELVEELCLFLVVGAIGLQRDIEQQIAVL